MLRDAIKARLPLIAVSSRDTINILDVIRDLAGKPASYLGGLTPKDIHDEHVHVVLMKPGMKEPAWEELYLLLGKKKSILIVVNPNKVDPAMFDAGAIEVPKHMVRQFVMMAFDDNDPEVGTLADELVKGLGDSTLKDTAEVMKLTMARDHSFTVDGLMRSRKEFFQGQKGLTQVFGDDDFYDPPDYLTTWINREREFFLNETDPRLIPRGLLFDGDPGTGKTAGAKYLSRKLGVPLFRFDVAATKNKWVGDSERFMLSNLQRIDREQPCIVLFDEIEKIFTTSRSESDGSTTTSMLSQLLWWLAEHQSRVLSIMTTNAVGKIPPELHRERRIDETMIFRGLPAGEQALAFVVKLLATFGINAPKTDQGQANFLEACQTILARADQTGRDDHLTQARLTESTIVWIKQAKLKGLTTTMIKQVPDSEAAA